MPILRANSIKFLVKPPKFTDSTWNKKQFDFCNFIYMKLTWNCRKTVLNPWQTVLDPAGECMCGYRSWTCSSCFPSGWMWRWMDIRCRNEVSVLWNPLTHDAESCLGVLRTCSLINVPVCVMTFLSVMVLYLHRTPCSCSWRPFTCWKCRVPIRNLDVSARISLKLLIHRYNCWFPDTLIMCGPREEMCGMSDAGVRREACEESPEVKTKRKSCLKDLRQLWMKKAAEVCWIMILKKDQIRSMMCEDDSETKTDADNPRRP